VKLIRSLIGGVCCVCQEIPEKIGETRKTLGEKNSNGQSKQTHCWTDIRLTSECEREFLEAKAKADKDNVYGQQRLDD
jgi:hypothetical protein